MTDARIQELLRASLDGTRELTAADPCVGTPLLTDAGVTVIPISRVSITLASGGVELTPKRWPANPGFGGGGGSGITVTPTALLTVTQTGDVRLHTISPSAPQAMIDRALSLIERAPELLFKLKESLFPEKCK